MKMKNNEFRIGDVVRAEMGECGDLIGIITKIEEEKIIVRKYGYTKEFEFKEEELIKLSKGELIDLCDNNFIW